MELQTLSASIESAITGVQETLVCNLRKNDHGIVRNTENPGTRQRKPQTSLGF